MGEWVSILMPIGGVGLGFSSALADYMQSERERSRKAEDDQMSYQMELIKSLAARPDINQRPEIMGQAIHDLMDLSAAKGGRAKQKAGVAGFMGAHDLPVSQFLTGLATGARPISGETERPDVESASEPLSSALQRTPDAGPPTPQAMQANGSLNPTPVGKSTPAAPTGGLSILGAPIAMPPPGTQGPPEAVRMIEAGRQMKDQRAINPAPSMSMQPVRSDMQPYFRSSQEMAREQGQNKGIEAGGLLSGTMKAEYDTLVGMGTPPDKALTTVQEKYGLKQPIGKMGSTKEFVHMLGQEAVKFYATPVLGPDNQLHWVDEYGRSLPPDAEPVEKVGTPGSQYQQHVVVQPDGKVQIVYAPKNPAGIGQTGPQLPGVPPPPDMVVKPTGVTSRMPPPPQAPIYVYDTPDPNNPGQTIPTAVDKRNLLPGAGKGAPAPKVSKLNTEEQTFVDTAQGTQKTLDRVQKMIEDAGLQHANTIADWGSQRVQNWWRSMGFEPDQFHADLQQRVGYVRATLLRSLLGGRPNKYVTEIFQSHLPAEFQTPAQIYNTMKLVRQEIQDRYDGIQAGHGGQPLPSLGRAGGAEQDLMKFLTGGKTK